MSGGVENTPKLRFPEFSGEWEERPVRNWLDKVVDYRGKAPPKSETGTPLITARNVKMGYLDFEADEYIDEQLYVEWMNRGLPRPGDVLFTTEAPLGNVAQYPKGKTCALGQRIITLQTKSSDLTCDFLFQSLLGPKMQSEVQSRGTGSTAKGIKSKLFVQIPLLAPKLPEQQKIGAFLEAVDAKIGQLTRKKALLEDYKKGCMQQLFTQKIRFKDNQENDFPEWEVSTIGQLGHFYYGKSAPKFSLAPDAPTPCVRYGELYSKYGIVIEDVNSRTTVDPKNLKFSKGGEILVPRVGEDPLDFATCCLLNVPNVAIGEMISVYNTEENPLFYAYYFRTYRKQFARMVEGGNVSNLYYAYLEDIPIARPHPEEQQKIADFLSAIDAKISLVADELSTAQDFKKGLLQQMFI